MKKIDSRSANICSRRKYKKLFIIGVKFNDKEECTIDLVYSRTLFLEVLCKGKW
ncbi:hypothetical protein [Polaribacter sp.]|uniref:hypothetical protein n=1 Tax=Polaribacter sp. TaxID=1920175 RepID=UPI003EF8EEF2